MVSRQLAELRHSTYYLRLLQQQRDSILRDADPRELELEWANVKRGQAVAAKMYRDIPNAASLCLDYATSGYFWRVATMKLQEAISWCDIGFAAAKTLGVDLLPTGIYDALITSHSLSQDNESAIDYCEQYLDLARRSGHRELVCHALLRLGSELESRDRPLKAIPYYDEALQISAEEGNVDLEVMALIGRGNIYKDCGNGLKAKELYERALMLLQDRKSRSVGFDPEQSIGGILLLLGRYKEAADFFDATLDGVRDNSLVASGILYQMGEATFKGGDMDRSRATYTKLLEIGRRSGHRIIEATASESLGSTNQSLGNTSDAFAWYQEAVHLYEQDDPGSLAHALMKMGELSESQGDARQSIARYERALRLTRDDPELKSTCRLRLIMTHLSLGERKQARALSDDELKRVVGARQTSLEARALLGSGFGS